MTEFTIEQSSIDSHPEIAVVTLHGEVDAASLGSIEAAVHPLTDTPTIVSIVFVVSDVSYMNSRAVGLLMNVYSVMNEKQRTIALVGLQDSVKETMSLVGVTQLVPVFESLQDYIDTLNDTGNK